MISKLSEIDVMTVSQILSLLEKHDFVKRKEHSRDTRAKVVILNKKGEEILQTAVPRPLQNSFPPTAETQTKIFGCFYFKYPLILLKYPLNPPWIPD